MRAPLLAVLALVVATACAATPVLTPGPTDSLPTPGPTLSPTLTATPTLLPTLLPTIAPTYGPTATATAVPTDSPAPSATPAPTKAPPAGFKIDLYRKGAFVSELEKYMCLPAAMQVMINMMKSGPVDTTAATQMRLYALARTFLVEPYVHGDVGAQPEGWAGGLNAEGYGPYEMVVRPTLVEAIHVAAKQIRVTGKPVGLLVWRGAHSWAMSGFKSDVDPLVSDKFTVTGIYAEDVWYPRISTIWGPSFGPDTFDPIEDLPIDYLKYRRPHEVHPDKDGQYVLIVPTTDDQGV